MNYGDIMVRIAELIHKAQNEKDNSRVASIRGYFILEGDISEFNELLELENTFYLLNTTENPTLKNDVLLELCKERASIDNEYTNDYLALMEILNNAYGKKASELLEHLGYYISKENIVLFHNLCNKLKVGPYTKIKTMKPEDAKNIIGDFIKNKTSQFKRIKKYVLKHFNLRIGEAKLIQDEKHSRDFMEIISLGLDGHLTKEMVASLKSRLSADDYKRLITKLVTFNIFTTRDLEEPLINSGEKEILNIDELVVFLANREQLDVEALKTLIPAIGIYNYHYIIDELFKIGAINMEDYIHVIKGYLSDDSMAVESYIGVIDKYIEGAPKR